MVTLHVVSWVVFCFAPPERALHFGVTVAIICIRGVFNFGNVLHLATVALCAGLFCVLPIFIFWIFLAGSRQQELLTLPCIIFGQQLLFHSAQYHDSHSDHYYNKNARKCLNVHSLRTNFSLNVHSVCTNLCLNVHRVPPLCYIVQCLAFPQRPQKGEV